MDFLLKGFFLVTCCWTAFALVPIEMGALPPPSNVSLDNSNYFCVKLSWRPPENLNSSLCSVKYYINVTTAQGSTGSTVMSPPYTTECQDVEDGVSFSVHTQPVRCGNRTVSKVVVRSVARRTEKLVKDFECVYYKSGAMNCTWQPAKETKDLRLYYWYPIMPKPLEHCNLYQNSGADKPGCHLKGSFLNFNNLEHKLFFLFNGTRGSSSLQNTFQMVPRDHIMPSPPKLRISEEGSMLQLDCDTPVGFNPILDCWKYNYRYKNYKSQDWQERHNTTWGKPLQIPYDRSLQYQVQVKVEVRDICGKGSSDWSEMESYGEQQAPDSSFHMALIAIPVMATVCVILFLLFFKKLQLLILPQIPDPMKLFKDLINSKEEGKATGSNLMENAADPLGKSSEKQKLYVPETPELCVNVRVEEPEREPIIDP
ncbi:hypothetical protein SKAU_G00366880 [Synaphobranchus kaupii]|uniref:Fibronectin type-III domain-containing protein n=1 Tax=Synaphobranchus kaupii TaxID=118154 RepID=A0A9Q1EFB9_SYNKA|nr:hypothetical protein SKAU_G00366880 [Synaphobranchus kaupii]